MRDAFARRVDADERLAFVTADLMSDQGWADAVTGCRFVLHVASPNPPTEPKDEDALIEPARDGTLRVLRTAVNAGVQRVVLTSSIAAIVAGHDPDGRIFTEDDWANIDAGIGAYAKSKTVAVRAAWDFIANLPAGKTLELAAINPSYVIGPQLDEHGSPSVEVIRRLLRREVPGCPRLGFPIVDVRDVAAAHLLAMTAPQAVGKRFICSTEFFWVREIALVLEDEFAGQDYRIPTRPLPDFAIRLMALFDGGIRRLTPSLGQRTDLSSELLKSTLDWQPRPVQEAIVATAESLIEYGLAT